MIASGVKDDWDGGNRGAVEGGVTGMGGLWLGGKDVSFLSAGGCVATGKNGRKFSGCQLSPKPLGDKDETGKGGKLYLLWTSYNAPKQK